jgi:amino-acid N-acetyltransferase
MQIRKAKIQDAKGIHTLISTYAELERMLFKSMSDIYETIQIFTVADAGPDVVGCCALQVIWEDLAEIKSLAVDKSMFGKGIGRKLVEDNLLRAKELGLKRVFILTLEPGFFERLGFEEVLRHSLPMKVWSDCAMCSKQDHCDEIAMIYHL